VFDSILVANRGEVALRVIRACREMGIETVAVFSEADRDSLPVAMADKAVCIGPAPAIQSYLSMPNIISAALMSGAQAIHPGYGFLAENAAFARACADSGLTFIGPSPDSIERMGDKAVARETMANAGVPTVPGSDGAVESYEEALRFSEQVGFPVLIKASAGGGGKGMRVAEDPESLEKNLQAAKTEAAAAFGNDTVYIEKYLARPRHVEIQVLADTHGNAVYLFERDCSIQRRHQKLIEEAPSPFLSEQQRREIGDIAARGAASIGYLNAGTMEFLFDQDGSYYFMEMNTRIQVEHPVTEEVTGLDLVKEQIRVAAGEKLSVRQSDVEWRGHAIECRINAEDPANGFRPSPGKITYWYKPGGPGLRVDSHVYAGYSVPPYYDSMIGKLIAFGKDRPEALRRMQIALEEIIVEGVKTTIPFHIQALRNAKFQAGDLDTRFVESLLKDEPVPAA
jgi:acetyl-CoA carboxylase biotin carboxylase subunit